MARRDAFPEETEYRDTGCDAAPSCLRCPYVFCKFDLERPETFGAELLRRRAWELQAAGRSVQQIMAVLGKGQRQVNRYLA